MGYIQIISVGSLLWSIRPGKTVRRLVINQSKQAHKDVNRESIQEKMNTEKKSFRWLAKQLLRNTAVYKE